MKQKEYRNIFSGEFGGEILGGSTIYLGALALGGGVSNKIFKLAVGFSKLGTGKSWNINCRERIQ